MNKFATYVLIAVVETVWSASCLYLLDAFRKTPPVFIEIILIWFIASLLIWRAAKAIAAKPRTYGQFQSNIEEWNKLQKIMREDERDRRRRGT